MDLTARIAGRQGNRGGLVTYMYTSKNLNNQSPFWEWFSILGP